MMARFFLLLGLIFGFTTPALATERHYTLIISEGTFVVQGQSRQKITVNGTIPGPVLEFDEGDEAVITVENRLKVETSVHWHGVLVPPREDGAPGFNGFAGIKAGQSYTYRFPVRQAGTYWYHAHSMGQEQDGLYGGIIIHPKGGEPDQADRDYVILLSDMAVENAATIYRRLKTDSDYYQNQKRTLGRLIKDSRANGLSVALKEAGDWGKMRMLPTDLADVTGYSQLMNGLTPEQNWTGLFKTGERIRLRFINAAAMSFYDVRIDGLKMEVVAADGQAVTPVTVDQFRFGNAETYDVIVSPSEDKPYRIIAETLDREGFATGLLSPRQGATLPLPVHRPRHELSMSDMNMAVMMQDDPDMDMSYVPESGWAKTGAENGQSVLTYGDLRARTPQADTRPATREIVVRLTGNMERYIWTMNGKPFDPNDQIKVAFNERVRLTYVNETMMAHPVHLHGMFVQLENGDDPSQWPNKHTIIIPPGQTLSVSLSATEAGQWPLHCHLLFHMTSGMMTTVVVQDDTASQLSDHNRHDPMGSHKDHAPAFGAVRLEAQTGNGAGAYEIKAFWGRDALKIGLRLEGEWGERNESQNLLYVARPVSDYFDLLGGLGVDQEGHGYWSVGLEGLMPYFFETEAFVSGRADGLVWIDLRQENEILLTQKAILTPFAQLRWRSKADGPEGVPAGISEATAGLRLRYEITRDFAPYIEAQSSAGIGLKSKDNRVQFGLMVRF